LAQGFLPRRQPRSVPPLPEQAGAEERRSAFHLHFAFRLRRRLRAVMSEGGWNAFREAGKSKVLSETAVAELERPAVSHSIGIAPPLQGPEPDGEEAPSYRTEVSADPVTDEITPDIAPWTPDALEILHKPQRLARLRGIGHWSVLAIVPVAAA